MSPFTRVNPKPESDAPLRCPRRELAQLAVGAASKRISDLEDAVGAELLERHSRGVTLTLAGQALQRHAQRILADVDQLAADLSDHAAGIVGVVRLWANTSATTQFLPADLAGFIAAHPGIRIEMHEKDSADAVLAVLDGRADLGIFRAHAHARPAGAAVPARPAGAGGAARPRAGGARAHRVFAATEYEFVGLSQATSLAQRLAIEAQAMGRPLRVRIHVRSFDAMCQMVAAGLGIAVLPDAAVQPHLRSMGLARIEFTDAWAERELLIGVRDPQALARPVRLLLDHLTHPPKR